MQAERHTKANGGTLLSFKQTYLRNNDNYWTNAYEIEARKSSIENADRKLVRA